MSKDTETADESKENVTFTVKAGGGQSDEFTFSKGKNVGEAAVEVANEYGYDPDDPTFVHQDEGRLDRNKPLAPYDLDGEAVSLVNEEGGV